jgi:hypothetical protein
MREKRALYFEVGAQEVWLCDDAGRLRFFGPKGALERAVLVPSFPPRIEI